MGCKKFNNFETGKKAAEELLSSVSVRACVDQYVQDQLIIFMALAKGKSVIKTTPITLHTETAIFIAELLTDVSFCLIYYFGVSLLTHSRKSERKSFNIFIKLLRKTFQHSFGISI